MSFLSVENLNRIGATIEGFLYDTYKIQVRDLYSLSEFEGMLKELMEKVEEIAPQAPLAEKNKQVVLLVRNAIMEGPPDPAPLPLPSAAEMPAPVERTATKKEEPEDVFFQKLQELEQKRKVPPRVSQPPPTPPPAPAPPQSHAAAPPTGPALAPTLAVAPVAPQEHVIVAVPPPPRQGIPHIISSWDRNLHENPERAAMVWKGPFPSQVDPTGTSIAGLFLPGLFSSYTPHISLVIEGVGGKQTACILSPDSSHPTKGWARWSPIGQSLSYIRNLSIPWVIQLRTADGSLLPLGLDHYKIAFMEVDVTNQMAILRLASVLTDAPVTVLTESDFQVGDQIWIYTRNDKKKTEVRAVSKDAIQVRYTHPAKSPTISNAVHDWINARIMNYSRQWSLVLDLTRVSPT